MMTLLPLLLLASLAGIGLDTPPAVAPGPQAAQGEGIVTSWIDLSEDPALFLTKQVRFTVQFHSLPKTWNPYLTRFAPAGYVAVQAWADEQFPWIRQEYDRPVVRVFARRGTPTAALFKGARPHERYAIHGVVREVFGGSPWILVESATLEPEAITEGTVLHTIRAIEMMRKQAFGLAQAEFKRALAAPVPALARKELEKLRGQCAVRPAGHSRRGQTGTRSAGS